MENMCKSILKYTFSFFIILSLSSCKEPCLDLPLINEKTVELQSWYTDATLTTKDAESNIGISDNVNLTHNYQNYGDSIWDDCGNVTQAERSKVQYDFFNFPFTIETDFYKQGEEKGFSLRVNYNTYYASYNFTTLETTSHNSIVYLSDYTLNDMVYDGAFKVTFNETQNATEIKELVLVKNLGIIYILLNDGISIEMD